MKLKSKILLGLAGLLVIGTGIGGWYYYKSNRFYFAPRTESNLFALGQIEASKGRHPEAVKLYQELLSKDPNHVVAMRFMLESMMKLDDRSMIFPTLDRLIALEPTKENLEYAASVSLQLRDKDRADSFIRRIQTPNK